MLPLSPERQENIFKEQIDNIVAGIAELKYQEGNSFKVKDMERTKRSLEQQLEKLQSSKKTTRCTLRNSVLINSLSMKHTNLRICSVQQNCKMFRVFLRGHLRERQSYSLSAVTLTKNRR